MTKILKARVEKLENQREAHEKPLYVVAGDGEAVPEGVKCYSPDASPDVWDEEPN